MKNSKSKGRHGAVEVVGLSPSKAPLFPWARNFTLIA